MAQKKKPQETETKHPDPADVRPDGWDRFERAVDKAMVSRPLHHPQPAAKPERKKGSAK